jgi:D-alanyl-D-alanine carboxypeptidase
MKLRVTALCGAAGISALVIVRLATSGAIDDVAREASVARLAGSLAADATAAQEFRPIAFGRDDAVPDSGLVSSSVSASAVGGSLSSGVAPDETTPAPEEVTPAVRLALADPSEMLSPDTAPEAAPQQSEKAAVASPKFGTAKPPVDTTEVLDECFVADICMDRYLWALYQRTPKEDTIREEERRKVTVRKRGKLVTVTRTVTRHVDEEFSWKDRKAAERAGLSMIDYVFGGVDQSFRRRLFYMLHAAEEAGLSPGITSAFRDDYRQSIASGLKAADDRSYHGGSSRGGYGHGLAADVVSVKGETRAQRLASSEALWKWIDAHGKEFGIGRPYLDHDPPHVGPIDGKEYASHHSGTSARETSRTRTRHATNSHRATKHARTARSSRVRTS